MESGYKAFLAPIIKYIAPRLRSKGFGFEPEVTARLAKIPNIRIAEVGISYWGRTYIEGKKISWKDGVRAIGQIVYYHLIQYSFFPGRQMKARWSEIQLAIAASKHAQMTWANAIVMRVESADT